MIFVEDVPVRLHHVTVACCNSTRRNLMHKTQKIIALLILLAVLFCSSAACAQEKLILVVTLIRHGDRMPCHAISSSPYAWELGLGELTPLGINQEYLLGKSFRTRYVEQLGFLPPKYKDNSIYARSTNINRTIISAQSFLCGLYPPYTGPLLDNGTPALPYGYQPIPVRTVPEDQDRILLGINVNKKRYKEMVRQYVFNTDEWKKETSSCEDKFGRWSEIFGVKITNLMDLNDSGDNVNVRLLKGVPLPEGLTETEAREIVRLFQWTMAEVCKPRKISCFIAREFMNELIAHMEKAVKGPRQYSFILYSGHDTTLIPVLSALGAPLDSQPPFASNVSFELYRNKDEYSVKVRFNDKDIALPFSDKKTTCTLEQFREAVLDESW